jgi:hypothetical protein
MKLLIGCPVTDRNWILPQWFDHIEVACRKAGVTPQFLFLVNQNDQETLDLLEQRTDTYLIYDDQPAYAGDHRWNRIRYILMSELRNRLLAEVRVIQPDLFFSLDSDILLHEDAIVSLFDALEKHPEAWAIGAKCYLSKTSTKHVNSGIWTGRFGSAHWYRKDARVLQRVGILMAAKLMLPQAYNVDYEYNTVGEDLGWSANVMSAGGILFWDGRVINKHVMTPEALDVVDVRVGF